MTDTTDRVKLIELAERVEASDGEYDPALCSEIHDVLAEPKCVQPPNYCASLDAALTLRPEGWFLQLEQYTKGWTATLASHLWFDDRRESRDGSALSPAAALTAACLRAMAGRV
jgi:hypothetical protein